MIICIFQTRKFLLIVVIHKKIGLASLIIRIDNHIFYGYLTFEHLAIPKILVKALVAYSNPLTCLEFILMSDLWIYDISKQFWYLTNVYWSVNIVICSSSLFRLVTLIRLNHVWQFDNGRGNWCFQQKNATIHWQLFTCLEGWTVEIHNSQVLY